MNCVQKWLRIICLPISVPFGIILFILMCIAELMIMLNEVLDMWVYQVSDWIDRCRKEWQQSLLFIFVFLPSLLRCCLQMGLTGVMCEIWTNLAELWIWMLPRK